MLHPSEPILQALHGLSHGVTISDLQLPEQPIIWCNPAFCQLTGYSENEILGRNCRFLHGPSTSLETRHEIRTALTQHQKVMVEILNYRKDGSAFWNSLTIAPLTIPGDEDGVRYKVGFQTDITYFKSLETDLLHNHKLEFIGRMTSTVAHDLNNATTAVLGAVELLLMDDALTEQQRELCHIIAQAGKSLTGLAGSLLDMARRRTPLARLLHVREFLNGRLRLFQLVAGTTNTVLLDCAALESDIRVDEEHLTNALVNLIANARDAMPRSGTITVRAVSAREPHGKAHVLLTVEDSGLGMPPDIIELAFEPFFTTKPDGKGTGLGLASVRQYLHQLGGKVWIESTAGQGTSVILSIPETTADGHTPS